MEDAYESPYVSFLSAIKQQIKHYGVHTWTASPGYCSSHSLSLLAH